MKFIKFMFVLILFLINSEVFCESTESKNINSSLKINAKASGDLMINKSYICHLNENETYQYDNIEINKDYEIEIIYLYEFKNRNKILNEFANIRVEENKNYLIEFKTSQQEIDRKYWKKHFFEILTGVGPSYYQIVDWQSYNGGGYSSLGELNTNISFTFGYVNGINKYIGLGFCISGNIAFPDIYMFPGGAVLFSLMIGDLQKYKIAFLFDIGGGAIFGYKTGLYVKGFTFKFSHNLGFNSLMTISGIHNFSFEFGYTINWGLKTKKEFKYQVITVSSTSPNSR
jgi:hypothetical protein